MRLKNSSVIVLGAVAILVATLWVISSVSLAQGNTSLAASPVASPAGVLNVTVTAKTVASPTATPISMTTTVSATPVTKAAATATPTATMATGTQTAAGQLVGYGTDKDTFSRGEQATGYIQVKNTGNTMINDITASISASAKVPVVGQTTLGTKDYTFSNLNIQPGETKRIEFKADIPSDVKGVSTAGDYSLHATIKAGGTDLGSFSKDIKIT